jgi:hypothetical protein
VSTVGKTFLNSANVINLRHKVGRLNSYKEFIYLCIKREVAKLNDFKIITSHPMNFNVENLIMYDYVQGFENINWEAMATYGNETECIKHAKMAECLTEKSIPIEAFQCIYVKSEEVKKYILKIFENYKIQKNPPYINVMPNWFN